MRTINASEFKARCLAILDEVQREGQPLVILKRGKPVAEIGPVRKRDDRFPPDRLKGSVTILGDIVGPTVNDEDLDFESRTL